MPRSFFRKGESPAWTGGVGLSGHSSQRQQARGSSTITHRNDEVSPIYSQGILLPNPTLQGVQRAPASARVCAPSSCLPWAGSPFSKGYLFSLCILSFYHLRSPPAFLWEYRWDE